MSTQKLRFTTVQNPIITLHIDQPEQVVLLGTNRIPLEQSAIKLALTGLTELSVIPQVTLGSPDCNIHLVRINIRQLTRVHHFYEKITQDQPRPQTHIHTLVPKLCAEFQRSWETY